eukprot:TRINITY_DN106572_c0_g1_i1.p1 TRINITY_DN106572_c0_g1~~TRINITY_DN106572_c0_g1_i1.p1  ORF type:complete len:570 (-),score=94.53 TRINITY_DN106572_c0_g1_i1:21-1613(-)
MQVPYYWNMDTSATSQQHPPRQPVEWELDRSAQGTVFSNKSIGKTLLEQPVIPCDRKTIGQSHEWNLSFSTLFRTAKVQLSIYRGMPPSAETVEDLVDKVWIDVSVDGVPLYWVLDDDRLVCTTTKKPTAVSCKWFAHEAPGPPDGQLYFENADTGTVQWELPWPRKPPALGDVPPWLQIGSALEIVGLTGEAARFNGAQGRILRLLHDRAVIRLPDCAEQDLNVPLSCLGCLRAETLVRINGLSSKPELNRQAAKVERHELRHDGIRYFVQPVLSPQNTKSLKASRLFPISQLEDMCLDVVDPCHSWRRDGHLERILSFRSHTGFRHKYSIAFPTQFQRDREAMINRKWPLLVFLRRHGGGTFFNPHSRNKKSLEGRCGLQHAALNFVVVSPHCDWEEHQAPNIWVLELVEVLRTVGWIDHARVFLTGVAMGGMSTWELAKRRPEIFAAIMPVAAYHKAELTEEIATSLANANIPVIAVHARQDRVTPLDPEFKLWERLLALGAPLQVELTQDQQMRMLEKKFAETTFV